MIPTATDLHALLEACPNSICSLDYGGRIQLINAQGLEFIQSLQASATPLLPTDVMGKTWQDLAISHTLCQVLNDAQHQAIAQGTPLVRAVPCQGWDGQAVLYQCTVVPLPMVSRDQAIALYCQRLSVDRSSHQLSHGSQGLTVPADQGLPESVFSRLEQTEEWVAVDVALQIQNQNERAIALQSSPLQDPDSFPLASAAVAQSWAESCQMIQFQTLLNYEAIQRRITEQLRSSLNERDILQRAVGEIGTQFGLSCCNIFLANQTEREDSLCIAAEHVRNPQLAGLVLHAEDYPTIQQQIQMGWIFQFSTQLTHNDYGWVTIALCPIIDDNDAFLGDILLLREREQTFNDLELGLVQQITSQCAIAIRQARLYQAVQQQVTELEQLNRLKDDFLSTVSHELRSPMTNIKMATQMLEMILGQTLESLRLRSSQIDSMPQALLQKATHYVQILRDECRRETDLINDLLDLSRLESNQHPLSPTPLDVATWLQPVLVPFLERARSQQQHLVVSLPTLPLFITTDAASLERIVTELLTNACKYTPAGETIQVQCSATSDGLDLQILNSGVELTATELHHVFDRFYRVIRHDPWKYGGTGLGLALVKKLVEQLQGTIAIASSHQTVTCTVHLPLDLNNAGASQPD